MGAKMARPGEFSERAFLNDKMDLVQLEGVADLIASASEQAAKSALGSLTGVFSKAVNALVTSVIELRIYIEASIDFPEEEIDFLAEPFVLERITRIDAQLQQILKQAEQGRRLQAGFSIALVGSPNAGKSSAINSLTGNKKLARTSKTPGRTQLINFFHLTEQQRLVDLPGYGFAKVPQAVKREWTKQLENYLQQRQSLRGLVLLMDVRHPLQPFDEQMLGWALAASMPVHILLTKADKLKKGPAKSTLLQAQAQLSEHAELVSVQLFSALKHSGHTELIEVLDNWLSDNTVYDELDGQA